jgi:hypothetical protein
MFSGECALSITRADVAKLAFFSIQQPAFYSFFQRPVKSSWINWTIIFILKGSDDGVMHFEESCFRTFPSSNVFLKKQRFRNWFCFLLQVKRGEGVAPTLSKGPHRVGVTPPPLFYLKTEAEPVSETLFLNKKRWTMDKVLKQDFSKQSFFKYFL